MKDSLTERAGEELSEMRTDGTYSKNLQVSFASQSLPVSQDTRTSTTRRALTRDPAMRTTVGKKALERNAASSQTVSRFETEKLTQEENIEALSSINRAWVDRAIHATETKKIVLDMDSSEFPVHGNQEGSSYDGHFGSRRHGRRETARWTADLDQPLKNVGKERMIDM